MRVLQRLLLAAVSDRPNFDTTDLLVFANSDPVSCFASGGGWTGFGSTGEGSCGPPSSKTNMDGGSGHGIHNCTCSKTLSGPWELQASSGNAQSANGCKNHICLNKEYVACKYDGSLIITGTWNDKWKELNVTGADPDVCPKAPPLPVPAPWYLWQNGSSPSCPGGCGHNATSANGTVVCMKETDLVQTKVDDSFCMEPKPAVMTRACVPTAPCLPGPACFASGGVHPRILNLSSQLVRWPMESVMTDCVRTGGWTGFDAAGPGGCGLGGKTNMDGGARRANRCQLCGSLSSVVCTQRASQLRRSLSCLQPHILSLPTTVRWTLVDSGDNLAAT